MNAPQSVAPQFKTISVPPLGEIWPGKGGRFAGIGTGPDGQNHLVFVHEAPHEPKTWQAYVDWCKTLEADGHKDFRPMFRPDGALAYATMKDQFKDDWYWLGEVHAGDADYAWLQYFGNGRQDIDLKDYRYLACAVRSEPI